MIVVDRHTIVDSLVLVRSNENSFKKIKKKDDFDSKSSTPKSKLLVREIEPKLSDSFILDMNEVRPAYSDTVLRCMNPSSRRAVVVSAVALGKQQWADESYPPTAPFVRWLPP